jgi:lipopolysaccharide/colanic/teichoic acid biosynthesis glycosyltransferase
VAKEQDSQQNRHGTVSSPGDDNGLPLWKRVLDVGLIALMLPAVLFFGLLVALVVKCGSPGPIFFRQQRVGYKGRHFTCYKFRTMKVNAETDSHRSYTQQLINGDAPMTKLDAKKDSRLIPLAAPLRASGLDELPQLINVLRGEMSIVGPRPCIPYEFELYDTWQRNRFNATPGLTGLWQVSGKNRTTFKQMIELDIKYAERKSLWLDVRIIFKTVPAIWVQYRDMRAQKQAANAKNVEQHADKPAVSMGKPVSI